MRTPLLYVSILAAVCAFTSVPGYASSNNDLPVAFSVRTLTCDSNGGIHLQRGASRGDVNWAMRYKTHETLAPDVWVFSGYIADSDAAMDHGCSLVVITFDHDTVSDIQLVNKPAVAKIAANIKRLSGSKNFASR